MKQWIDADRTVFVRELSNGTMLVSLRPDSDAVWGPPIKLEEKPWP